MLYRSATPAIINYTRRDFLAQQPLNDTGVASIMINVNPRCFSTAATSKISSDDNPRQTTLTKVSRSQLSKNNEPTLIKYSPKPPLRDCFLYHTPKLVLPRLTPFRRITH